MAYVVAESLKFSGVNSFDDNTCEFLADGIQRTAVGMYGDRVNRIIRASGFEAKGEAFDDYAAAAQEIFPKLDESRNFEMKMFEDLWNATSEVRKVKLESVRTEGFVGSDAANYMGDLEEVLKLVVNPLISS